MNDMQFIDMYGAPMDPFCPQSEDTGQLMAYGGQTSSGGSQLSTWTGEKYYGGLGLPQEWLDDYHTQRLYSSQFFESNPYARGIIRKLLTNEVNTGLKPEAVPVSEILGIDEDKLAEWSEGVELRFELWGDDKRVCCARKMFTFWEYEAIVRMEALIGGDCLVVMQTNRRTGLPYLDLIQGERISSGLDSVAAPGNKIVDGVEVNKAGEHVAFHVLDEGYKHKRIPAYGSKSGRATAWLVYGTERRHKAVRGTPLLTQILQGLGEIDKYRDSAQRKALVTSLFAASVERSEMQMSTSPIKAAALRNSQASTGDSNAPERKVDLTDHIPGVILEPGVGERFVSHNSNGTDLNFAGFEEAILAGLAWVIEIPYNILVQRFDQSFSAAQGVCNEFKMYLDKRWAQSGRELCQPIFSEWLLSEVVRGNIAAPGLLDSYRDEDQYLTYNAWVKTEWTGNVRSSARPLETIKTSALTLAQGASTYSKEARNLTGTKFSSNVKRQKKELQALLELREMEKMLDVKAENAKIDTTQEANGDTETAASFDALDLLLDRPDYD